MDRLDGAAHGAHATSPLIGLKALISPGIFFLVRAQHTNGLRGQGARCGRGVCTLCAVVVFILKSRQTERGLLKAGRRDDTFARIPVGN